MSDNLAVAWNRAASTPSAGPAWARPDRRRPGGQGGAGLPPRRRRQPARRRALRPAGPRRQPGRSFLLQAEEVLGDSAGLDDERKSIAEYWADGPASETPPGHWCLLAQPVSARDGHDLDDDVKLFFGLSAALLDAGIACWDA